MSEKNLTDSLAGILSKLESWCSAQKLNLILGYLEENPGLPIVQYEGHGDNHDDFFQLLDRLNPSALVVQAMCLSREMWQANIDRFTNSSETPERNTRLQKVKACQDRIGQILVLNVKVFIEHPRLILSHQILSSWAVDFVSHDEEDNAEWDEQEDQDPKVRKQIETLARRLAQDPRFADAKNREAQAYLAESIFDSESIGEIDSWVLAQKANAIFSVDIKPKLEAELREKAKQLKVQGNSLKNVAEQLGVTVGHVQRLLS